ncbi:MAG TPA: hypothetical protein VI193_04260 [Acidimicrobiia bacterium]
MSPSRLLIVGLALVVACGEGAATSTTLVSTTTTTVPSTTTTLQLTTTAAPSTTVATGVSTTKVLDDSAEGSGCTPGEGPLPDGDWYGLVTSRGNDALDFDLACWFTGDAAVQASAEDGEESPPPNDYYVRNSNPDTREVVVGENIEVAFFPDGDPTNVTEIDYDDWADMVATRGFELGVWLKVEDGVISEISEMWVP